LPLPEATAREFSGVISGSFDNPKISGRALLSNVSIEGYKSDSISTDFVYQKNLLDVRESVFKASGEEHRIKGRIAFPEAKELFEFSMPVYNLTAYIRNAEFGKAVRIFYKDFDGEGRLNGDIKIAGKDKEIDISGNVSVEKASAYNIPFDSGSAVIAYLKREFSLRKVKIARGKTVLTGEGRLSADGSFLQPHRITLSEGFRPGRTRSRRRCWWDNRKVAVHLITFD
jgi:hypothetical protein